MSNTRKDYITWWKECSLFVKENFPQYIEYLKVYNLSFNQKKRSFGTCYYGRVTKIELSEYLCKNMKEEEVKDTILHEMAHGIDAGIRGYSNHDKEWKKIASELGATPLSYSKVARGIEYRYVCVVEKINKDLVLQYGFNKKRTGMQFNKKIVGSYIKGKKNTTINKLKMLHWDDWVYYCEQNDYSPFIEDWKISQKK
jgi:predicted SprT family Zn-dependent metalloprotease